MLLKVENLKVHFPIIGGFPFQREVGKIRAVDGVSFELRGGETLGLVGESGCGKSTTARAILRILSPTEGRVIFQDKDLAAIGGAELRSIYRRLQAIYQDPYASLNPRMTVNMIIAEPLRVFRLVSGIQLRRRVQELMELVGLDPRYINRYPHEFSGGQRQRIGIARALAVNPSLIICDEPVSALDVSIRAQIINLLEGLQEKFQFSYLFIAHDLSVVRHISNTVAVMYHGLIVEQAPTGSLFQTPLHPYTRSLLSAVPIPDPVLEAERKRIILTGEVPGPDVALPGCDFYSRCPERMPKCEFTAPEYLKVEDDHYASCLLLH
ncbi:MAG: oligopeptide/dipeptide ABC transporter ATP-binding protein [bacterium]